MSVLGWSTAMVSRYAHVVAPINSDVASRVSWRVSDERCKWPNTLSCGLAGKGRYDRNTVGREFTIIEGSG